MRTTTVLAALMALSCAAKAPPPLASAKAPASSSASSQAGAPAPSADGGFPQGGDEALIGEDRAWHARAREAVVAKDFYQAKRILLRLVAGYRKEKAFAAQLAWVQARIDAEAAPVARAMKQATLEAVPGLAPTFRSTPAANVPSRPIPKLALRSSTKNAITDAERWYREAGPLSEVALPSADSLLVVHIDFTDPETDRVLQSVLVGGWLPETSHSELRDAPFPAWIPGTYGTAPLKRVLLSEPNTLLVYGDRYLFVFDGERRLLRALDLFLWLYPESHLARRPVKVGEFKLTTAEGTTTGDLTVKDRGPRHVLKWAETRDGVLYVSTSYESYAKEVKGQTAFVTALDLGTGNVVFRSEPLTANGQNFVLVDGAIIAGYGFTSEPDFVFVVDTKTGKTLQRVPVPSSPEAFVWHEDRGELLVRTYDHDLVFGVRRN